MMLNYLPSEHSSRAKGLWVYLLTIAGMARLASTQFGTVTPDEWNVANNSSDITSGRSNGKGAHCVSDKVTIQLRSTNTKILLPEPANQTIVTEIIQELVQAGSTIAARASGGPTVVQGSYQISVTLCYPAHAEGTQDVQTVQVLTHGAGLDKTYWRIAPGYSYIDAAADAGYATVIYDRLGEGESDHPDSLQIVQCPTDVEILHGLVQLLRTQGVASKIFKRVVGVGHSYGSIVQLAHNAKYPKDVDAAVLTGFVNNLGNFPYTTVAFNPSIASINNPVKFGRLSNGYVVHGTRVSVQLPYFRHPFYEPNIFEKVYATKSTYTLGQLFTLPSIYGPAPAFTGPVNIVVGQHDFPFCLGDCLSPRDQAAATIPALYPAAAAASTHYVVQNSGHLLNAHYQASQAISQINRFLRANGF